jgi:hypothetical protein
MEVVMSKDQGQVQRKGGWLIPSIIREIIWSAIVVGVVVLCTISDKFQQTPKAVSFTGITFFLTFLGCFIGNILRRWIHPVAVFARGFGALLNAKIFWAIGPQLVGSITGCVVSLGLFGSMVL